MGFLKKAMKVVAAPYTGGASLLGGGKMKDLLFGKKDVGERDAYIDLDPSLKKAVEAARKPQARIGEMISTELDVMSKSKFDPKEFAKRKSAMERGMAERVLGQAGADARRRAEQIVAQRGMGRSRAGLSAILGADKESREKLEDFRIGSAAREEMLGKEMEDKERSRRLNMMRGYGATLGGILGTPGAQRTFMKGRKGAGRGGGLFKTGMSVAGGVLGGMFGGPAGAAAGSQIGGSLGGGLANINN